jgi:GNAT superfamily N-acetyltransferase
VERVTERRAIAAGVDRWNETVPGLGIEKWHVERSLFAPFDGVSVRCLAVGSEPRAFAVLKRLDHATPTYDATDTAWLSLFACTDRAAGRKLLNWVTTDLRERDISELSVGGAPQHLLAGIPEQLPESHVETLKEVGLGVEEHVYDLHRDLADYAIPDRCRAVRDERSDLELVSATGHESDLHRLLADQFPGRWQYEAANICRRPGGASDYWLLRDGDTPVAFVRSNRHDGPYRGPNLNWGAQFGDNYCGVGPLGVREDYRGEGLGLYATAAVVDRLAAAGYDHCVIDWTDHLSFYDRLGFEPFQTYRTAGIDLRE